MTTARTTYWAEHAWLPTGLATGVRFDVVDGVFAGVHRRAQARVGDIRLHGVVLPGLANAHSHAFHRALRGRTHGDGGNFWTWRQPMYAVTPAPHARDLPRPRPRDLRGDGAPGTTVVGEFHYLHHDLAGRPYADPNAMGEAVIEAARDAGMRLTLLDTCYLAGGLTADGHVPLDEEQRRFSDGDVDPGPPGGGARPDATTRIGAAIHSVRAVPRDDLRAWPRPGAVSCTSTSEQPAENDTICTTAHPDPGAPGRRALGDHHRRPRHAPHPGRHRAARAGLHDRVLLPHDRARPRRWHRPGPGLTEAGARLSLGSDQHAVIDPFEEVRGLEMHERLSATSVVVSPPTS